jgi:hypothetical protein
MHLRHNHSEPDESAAATMSWRRRTALVLAVALPIPVFAASGLALPMPSVIERLVRSLVTGTEAPVHDFADGEGAVVDAYGGGGPRSPRTREREVAAGTALSGKQDAGGALRPPRRAKRPPRLELPPVPDAVGAAVLTAVVVHAESPVSPVAEAPAVSAAPEEPVRAADVPVAKPARDEAAVVPAAAPAASEKPVEPQPAKPILEAVRPPAVDLPAVELPAVEPPAAEPPVAPLPAPAADAAVENATSAILDASGTSVRGLGQEKLGP